MNRKKRILWITLSVSLLAVIIFVIDLGTSYQNLKKLFMEPGQFVPTRIYSDVFKLVPSLRRDLVLRQLEKRHYSIETAPASDETHSISITLRALDFPESLIPQDHPSLLLIGQKLNLAFDGSEPSSRLTTLRVGEQELSDVYLEPELVATLSQSSDSTPQQIREVLSFEQFPPSIWKAIMSAEDQHFLEHSGFDLRGVGRAILANLKSLRFAQGGSTLTQQLVKNLMARRNKNPIKKLSELFMSIGLEIQFGKEAIMGRYLNEVYLGQVGNMEVHGVAEGARHFFGKNISDLQLGEMALLAGLIRGPAFYSPYRHLDRAIERQHWVLKRMVETGQLAEAEAQEALSFPIRLAPPQVSSNEAPYFTDFVKAELVRLLKEKLSEQEITSAGFRVYTTLDTDLNEKAQRMVAQGVQKIQGDSKDRLEGALASVEQSTGFIRALVGGRSYSESNFNRVLNMRRQVGSTFKPIVFLAALEKGADDTGVPYGPGYPLDDTSFTVVYDHGKQKWSPKNYEKSQSGWVSSRTALAESLNIPTARLALSVGLDPIIATAKKMGITSDLPAVPSLALGIVELTPVELLQVYATFAHQGLQDELTVIRAITENDGKSYARFIYQPEPRIEPSHADTITEMLKEVFISGTARFAKNYGVDFPVAGKTGTTSAYRDAWFAGFTPELTTVVWVGFDQTPTSSGEAPRNKLTGASAALPIWSEFMKVAHQRADALPFLPSRLITSVRIDRRTGQLATDSCPDEQVLLETYPSIRVPDDETCAEDFPPHLKEIRVE